MIFFNDFFQKARISTGFNLRLTDHLPIDTRSIKIDPLPDCSNTTTKNSQFFVQGNAGYNNKNAITWPLNLRQNLIFYDQTVQHNFSLPYINGYEVTWCDIALNRHNRLLKTLLPQRTHVCLLAKNIKDKTTCQYDF